MYKRQWSTWWSVRTTTTPYSGREARSTTSASAHTSTITPTTALVVVGADNDNDNDDKPRHGVVPGVVVAAGLILRPASAPLLDQSRLHGRSASRPATHHPAQPPAADDDYHHQRDARRDDKKI